MASNCLGLPKKCDALQFSTTILMQEKMRIYLLDILRGLSVLAMIFYHFFWDLGYGYDLRTSKITGFLTIIGSFILAVLIYLIGKGIS